MLKWLFTLITAYVCEFPHHSSFTTALAGFLPFCRRQNEIIPSFYRARPWETEILSPIWHKPMSMAPWKSSPNFVMSYLHFCESYYQGAKNKLTSYGNTELNNMLKIIHQIRIRSLAFTSSLLTTLRCGFWLQEIILPKLIKILHVLPFKKTLGASYSHISFNVGFHFNEAIMLWEKPTEKEEAAEFPAHCGGSTSVC